MSDLRKLILSRCITARGFNPKCASRSWWSNRGLDAEFDALFSATNFLSEAVSTAQRCWHILNCVYELPVCEVCGVNSKSFDSFKYGYHSTCSRRCASRHPERAAKIVAHTDYAERTKTQKITIRERYGVDYGFQIDSVKQKISQTKLEKHGSETYNNNEKREATCNERYGSKHWFTSDEGINHLKSLREENSGSLKLSRDVNERLNDPDLLQGLNKNLSIQEIADEIGVSFSGVYKKFIHLGLPINRFTSSKQALQGRLVDDISKIYDGSIVVNDRSLIPPLEIDILLPEVGLGLELNGLYWHSYDNLSDEDPKRHIRKSDAASRMGVRIFHLTDEEYLTKREIILSTIGMMIGRADRKIRASSCELCEIETAAEREFLERNHLQGYTQSSTALGLKYDGRIISTMTFTRSRFSKNYDAELLRYASEIGTRVYGAPAKMFRAYIGNHPEIGSIISYCDISKFSGGMYRELGFSLDHRSGPGYFYWNKDGHVSRNEAQKSKLHRILGDKFDASLSESANMFNNGFRRYWNCGNDAYVWRRSVQ